MSLFGVVLASAAPIAQATIVDYALTDLGGSQWQYHYTVHNDTLGTGIDEFSIYFDTGLYENLTVVSAAADWDPIVIEPDAFFGSPGLYDALALVAPLAPGATLGGFSVQFAYLGGGTPGSQYFEIVDPNDFTVLDSGYTVAVAAVPLPPALYLFGSACAAIMGFAARRRSLVS